MIRIAVKFGAFVVVCLAFTSYLAFTIGNLDIRDPLGRNAYSVTATFDDVTGLLVNDNVKVAGVVVGKVTSLKKGEGYDAAADKYGNMVALGIIDPAKVTKAALENAVSIAGMVLTTNCLVTDIPEDNKAAAGAGAGMDMY